MDGERRVQDRLADRLEFQIGQAVRLRDAEISRLKDELQKFRDLLHQPRDLSRHEPLQQTLLEKKRQLEKAKSELSRLPPAGSLRADSETDDVDDFLASVRPTASRVAARTVTDAAAELEVKRLDDESTAARRRIEQLQRLIEKVRTHGPPSIGDGTPPQRSAAELRARHDRRLEEIEREIAQEKVKRRKLRESLARMQDATMSAATPFLEEGANAWTVEVARLLAEGTEQERRQYLARLMRENARLKAEIGRIDFVVYGRAGKFQKWRRRGQARPQTPA
jgi:hypothetical protein